MVESKRTTKIVFQNKKVVSWDRHWEKIFRSQVWGKYPPEELIRFTSRNFYKSKNKKNIIFLDIGCGTGSCSWYLAKEGFSVFGVDGSKTAIQKAKQRFRKENLEGVFKTTDFVKLNFPDDFFDAIIDVCAIQHNPVNHVPLILHEIKRVLKPGGKLFSMIVSEGTFMAPYMSKGYVHFYKLSEIRKLFKNYSSIERSERTENNMKDKIIHWVISCEKEDL